MLKAPNLLPDFVRKMSQMSELLDAESPEVERLEALIQHQVNQLYLRSANDTLARYEDIFAVSSNRTLDHLARQDALLVKANTRCPMTLQKLHQLVEEAAKAQCRITEHYAQKSISVDLYERDFSHIDRPFLTRQITEMKPAHIALQAIHIITETPPMQAGIFLVGVLGRGYTVTRLPEIGIDFDAQNTQRVTADAQNITQTVLPRLEEEKT